MPMFEYRCTECGHVTTFLEKAGARKRHACEQCRSMRTEKLLSTFAARSGSPAAPSCESCVADGRRAASCPSGTCPLA